MMAQRQCSRQRIKPLLRRSRSQQGATCKAGGGLEGLCLHKLQARLRSCAVVFSGSFLNALPVMPLLCLLDFGSDARSVSASASHSSRT